MSNIGKIKNDAREIRGKVLDCLPNAMFSVQLESGQKVLAHIAGKLRLNRIKIMTEDNVTVELSPYDLTRGRIIWRNRN